MRAVFYHHAVLLQLSLTNDNGVSVMRQNCEYYPLTHPQRGIWYTEKLFPGTSIGIIAATLKIHGDVDYAILEKAVNLLIEKNDAISISNHGTGQ